VRERRWKLVALLASGIVIGVALAGTPAAAHVGGTVGHLWSHLRPWADARYDRPTVEPGETIRGTIGGQVLSQATSTEWGFNAQLPRAAPVALDDAHVVINGVPADEPTPVCTGTAANPTASPGYVCIYPYSTGSMNGLAGSIWGTGTNKWGFQVSINASAIGEVYWFANWAYRAPTS
jgi:hypothetical protein